MERFDLTMAATALLVPTIVLASLLLLKTLNNPTAEFSPYFELVWGVGTLVSRFWIMIPALAIAGSFATSGTFTGKRAK